MTEQQIVIQMGNDLIDRDRQIAELKEQRDAVIFTYNQADAECAMLRTLITELADALQKLRPSVPDLPLKSAWWKDTDELIQKAREAGLVMFFLHSFDMWFHPGRMLKHPTLSHFDLALDVQVATLAKYGQIPVRAV